MCVNRIGQTARICAVYATLPPERLPAQQGFFIATAENIEVRTGPVASDESKLPGRQVMDADEIRRAVTRMFHEILERNHGADGLGCWLGYAPGACPWPSVWPTRFSGPKT